MINDFYASDDEFYLPGVPLYRGINQYFSISRPLSTYIDNNMEYYVLIEKTPFSYETIESTITCRIFLTKPEYYIAGKVNDILSQKELDLFIKVLSDRWSHVIGFLQDIYDVDNLVYPDYSSLLVSTVDHNYIPDNWLECYDKEYYYYLPYHHLPCKTLDGYDAPDDEESSRWIDLAQDLGGHMFISGANHTKDNSDMYVTVIKNGKNDNHMFRRAFNEWIVARVSIFQPKYVHTEYPDDIFTRKELERFNSSMHNNWKRLISEIYDTYYFGINNDKEFNIIFTNLQCPNYLELETLERPDNLEFF